MFGFKPITQQIIDARNENAKLRQQVAKQEADLDFVAMMADVDIPEEEVPENEEC